MGPLSSLSRLTENSRSIIVTLLDHPALRRLGRIRQVGFSSFPQQSRLRHTVESIELTINFLETMPTLHHTIINHVLAAIALEDVGRAPFSNSLDEIFVRTQQVPSAGAIDVSRSISVIEHLDRTEKLLSKHGLSADIVCMLLRGEIPWLKLRRLRGLLRGATDVDRLQYVPGDSACAEGLSCDISGIARGLKFDAGSDETVIDAASVQAVMAFLLERTKSFMQNYYEPAKLAMECVMRSFFQELWRFTASASNEWQDIAEPDTIDRFLLWTDATVVGSVEGDRWQTAPKPLKRLRRLIRSGGFQTAELRQRGLTTVDINRIEELFSQVRDIFVRRDHCWALDGVHLPFLQPYEPGTLLVAHKGVHQDIAKSPEMSAIPELLQQRRRAPILVFPTSDFALVQSWIHDVGLVFSTPLPLEPLRHYGASAVLP